MGCEAVQSGIILPVISVEHDNFDKGIYVSPIFISWFWYSLRMTFLALFVRFFVFTSSLNLQAVCSCELFVNTHHVQGHNSTGVLISPWPDQEGNKLQRPNSNFCKPLKNNSEGCPSNQVSAAAMNSASNEKWRPFICFFSRFGLRTYQHPCINILVPFINA